MQISENRVGYNGRSRPSDDKPNAKPENASVQRFVIPAADILRAVILPVQPNEVEHICIGSSMSTARQSQIAEQTTRSIESGFMVLAASTLIIAHWTSMSLP